MLAEIHREGQNMTSKERCVAVLNHEEPDRVPFFPLMMFFAAGRAKLNYRAYATEPSALAEAQLNLFDNYHVDAVTACSDAYRITADLGGAIGYPEDQTPHAKTPLLKSIVDFRALKRPDPMKPGSRMRGRVDAVEMLARSVGNKALVCGWVEMPFAEVCDWFGVENTMMMLFDEPEFVHEALSFAAELEIDFAKAQIDAGAHLIGCGDAAASLISAKFFQEFALPYEQKVTKAIKEYGAYSKLHICGNTTQSLPLLASSGASLVNIDSLVEFGYARKIFEEAGVAFKGNADPVRDLLNATPVEAAAKGRDLVRRAKGAAFMLSAGCEIPAAVKDEVYFAFADSVLG